MKLGKLYVASGASVISDHNIYRNILFLYGHSGATCDRHKKSSLTKQGAVQSPAPSLTRGHGETNITKESKKHSVWKRGQIMEGSNDFVVSCTLFTLLQCSNHLYIQHPDTKAAGIDKKMVGKKQINRVNT